MNWRKWADRLFPYIEPLTADEEQAREASLAADIEAVKAARFDQEGERALDEAQRVASAETERVRTSEAKASTYLAVLAALVPLVITLQAATWERKSGPAPEALKLGVLALATLYVAAAGYHAFRTLRVSGFQRIGESEVAKAWRAPRPLERLARSTLLASRGSRDAVNLKVTYIKVTHEHLVRAFGAFVLLLILDPVFYALGFRSEAARSKAEAVQSTIPPVVPRTRAPSAPPTPLPANGTPPETGKVEAPQGAVPSSAEAMGEPADAGSYPATGRPAARGSAGSTPR